MENAVADIPTEHSWGKKNTKRYENGGMRNGGRNSRTPIGRPVCFMCNRPGHFAASCMVNLSQQPNNYSSRNEEIGNRGRGFRGSGYTTRGTRQYNYSGSRSFEREPSNQKN